MVVRGGRGNVHDLCYEYLYSCGDVYGSVTADNGQVSYIVLPSIIYYSIGFVTDW